jgi:hypothetical protein
MFSLPAGCGDDGLPVLREGSSDENPIVLQEEADHFRALLWCLYSLSVLLYFICAVQRDMF